MLSIRFLGNLAIRRAADQPVNATEPAQAQLTGESYRNAIKTGKQKTKRIKHVWSQNPIWAD